MIIRSIETSYFGVPHKVKLDLPEKGLVLVTGNNGQGKTSSCIEAPAVACWNKPLRGAHLWRKDQLSHVKITTNDLEIKRIHEKSTKLFWDELDSFEPTEYETPTKAQKALEKHIGAFKLWRNTSVFRSRDAANFTQATDGDRKHLLEMLLDLERFDEALAKCRKELSTARKEQDLCQREMAKAAVQLSERKGVCDRLQNDLDRIEAVPNMKELESKLAQIDTSVKEARNKEVEKQTELSQLNRKLASIDANISSLDRQYRNSMGDLQDLEKRLASGTCPTCGGEITGKSPLIERMEDKINEITKEQKEAKTSAELSRASAGQDLLHLQKEIKTIRQRQYDMADERPDIIRQLAAGAARKKAEGKIVEQKLLIDEAADITAKHEKEFIKHEINVLELVACEDILGLRGVRATMLSEALSGLEGLANAWLTRLVGPSWSVSLAPYSEKKDGGLTEAIALDITGAGDGNYKTLSDGQQRRIDVAFLFALAEMASAAHGAQAGTLLLDEITDPPLDQAGRDTLVGLLLELAETRPVVVITHSDNAVSSLQPHAWRWYHMTETGAEIRT